MTAARLAQEVELLQIRTVALHARLWRGPMPKPGAPEFDAAFALASGFRRGARHHFDVSFQITCKPCATGQKQEFARFLFRGVAQYRATQDWPDGVLLEFSRTNAVIHLWPYARQFIHAASTQLNVPPVLLPPFRVKALGAGMAPEPKATRREPRK